MWWVTKENSKSFEENYGPWQGVDYARFSDPPNLSRDQRLLTFLEQSLAEKFPQFQDQYTLKVKNGFVILKTSLDDENLFSLRSFLYSLYGVREVILSREEV